ncbi:EamA family transporter [uncultured Planktomarina sp.]|uniref:DMT family transporter n=1 Tax=uncultured Planktomarina sp. TaxID=1538529 RepID=UPI0032616AFA
MNLQNPSSNFASAAVLVSAAIWGLYWIPLRYLEGLGVAEAWTVALINIPAAAAVGVIFLVQFKAQKPHLRRGFLIGIFMGLTVAMFTIGLVHSSVVRVTLLFYLTPVWSTLIGTYWLKEPITRGRWLAIAIGLLGLGFLVSQGGGDLPLNIGDLYGFVSGITWAIGGAMIKRYGEIPMPTLLVFQFLLASGFALLLGAAAGLAPTPSLALLYQVAPASMAISIGLIFPSVLIIFWAQKFLYPGRVGLLIMTEVMVAILTASLFLPNEALGFIEWIGACLIVGACLVEIIEQPAKA